MPVRSASACSTPIHTPQDSLTGVGGDVQEAFAQSKCHYSLLCFAFMWQISIKDFVDWSYQNRTMDVLGYSVVCRPGLQDLLETPYPVLFFPSPSYLLLASLALPCYGFGFGF